MDMAVSFTEGQYAVKKHSEEQICWRVNIPERSADLRRMEWIAFRCDCPMPMPWTLDSGQGQKPIRKMAHNKGAFGLSVFIRSLKRKYSHKFQDQMKTWDCIFA